MTHKLNLEQEHREFEAWYFDSGESGCNADRSDSKEGMHAAFKEMCLSTWLAAKRAAMGGINHDSAEDYLRARYGAYRGHFAWRELQDAFNAGRAAMGSGEPVAYVHPVFLERFSHKAFRKGYICVEKKPHSALTPLYTAPPAAAKDAERYRMLRRADSSDFSNLYHEDLDKEVDAAIDAAREAKP